MTASGRARLLHAALGTLLVAAQGRDEATGEHHRGDVRLGREHPADLLAHHRHLDRPGVHAAVGLGEGEPEHAHLREAPPQALVEAGVRRGHLAAAVGVDRGVVALEQSADGVAQRLLLLVQREVHVVSLQSPRIVPAMIWRWISLDPP